MLDPRQQLAELLNVPEYQRTIDAIANEVVAKWGYSRGDARRTVLSAIGEPSALASIHAAWLRAKTGGPAGLPALITRRRTLDLLVKDARRPGHSSMPPASDELDAETTQESFIIADLDPRAQLECQQRIQLVRAALTCFAAQGLIETRQAHLLRRRVLEEAPYRDLAVELNCKEAAVRVRVHAALHALYRHILWCHPELISTHTALARQV